jgi:hypothetical protein
MGMKHIGAYYNAMFGGCIPGIYRFSAGAQYVVPRAAWMARPLAFYQKWLEKVRMCHEVSWRAATSAFHEDRIDPWTLARLWPYMWDASVPSAPPPPLKVYRITNVRELLSGGSRHAVASAATELHGQLLLRDIWDVNMDACITREGVDAAPVKVLCTTSENYQEIYKIFHDSLVPSIQSGRVQLMLQTLDLSKFQGHGFGLASWHRAIVEKLRFVQHCLATGAIAPGAYAVVSDADIQYIQPEGLERLVQGAHDGGLDYYGMREYTTSMYNGGFYILRNTPTVAGFLADVLASMRYKLNKYADQEILNDLLSSNRLRHAKIDTRFCIWGNGNPCKETVFHHAVCAFDNLSKSAQMAQVRQRCDTFFACPNNVPR